ncbi:MAG: adenylyltransferase/cytidyltransferase family protein [Lachnospiraceae bacterium]|nr:adenylyltransferase/cytidyltransferase family protein [Lachnospiraceae bacterium]
MTRVITYGTYDLLHFGHIKLLERAKALGDYLIVGVTSDDFDMTRGKINVQQPLMERIEALQRTGLADEIIVEEYDGQKIDDIRRFNVDIFTVGSDWEGKFDYLNEYCKVIYLPRTEGVSSSEVRAEQRKIRMGFVGDYESRILVKYYNECKYVNGIEISGVYARNKDIKNILGSSDIYITQDFSDFLKRCDAIYVLSHPSEHYEQIKEAIAQGVHILCESPIALKEEQFKELNELAKIKNVVLMNSIKTAYSTAYYRLLLLVKSGRIGDIISIDTTCTSIQEVDDKKYAWNSICLWGPTALLPIVQILGTEYLNINIVSRLSNDDFDQFTKIDFLYTHATATLKVGRGIKSEGEMIISGTKGYIYVPAPWWKTDYFEIRYENSSDNRRYFYPLEGEGIRYELVDFVKTINTGIESAYISSDVSGAICRVMDSFYKKENFVEI